MVSPMPIPPHPQGAPNPKSRPHPQHRPYFHISNQRHTLSRVSHTTHLTCMKGESRQGHSSKEVKCPGLKAQLDLAPERCQNPARPSKHRFRRGLG